MAYIFVNVNRSVGTINPNIYGQFSSIWAAASIRAFMSVRLLIFPTPTACAMMLYPR